MASTERESGITLRIISGQTGLDSVPCRAVVRRG
jgi:hypothetical protein